MDGRRDGRTLRGPEGAWTLRAALVNLVPVTESTAPMSAPSPEDPVPGARRTDLDTALVRRAQDGDREAFRRVYDRYAAMVHGILISCVGPEEAQDLVQEVFLKALQKIADLREPGQIGSWLAAIARNAGRDALRAARPTEPLPEHLPGPDGGPGSAGLEAREVLAVLQGLPDAYRESLALRLVEGMTGREIARRTGLTEGSVRVNLHRGMKMFREALSRRGLS